MRTSVECCNEITYPREEASGLAVAGPGSATVLLAAVVAQEDPTDHRVRW